MEEFLTKLYSYDYFKTYLIGAIILLIILFIMILVIGKKDQKKREIEATKKLMQINDEAADNQLVVEDNSKTEAERLESDTIIVPNINELNIGESVENNIDVEIPEPVLPDNLNNEVISELNSVEDVAPTISPEPTFPEWQANDTITNGLPKVDETPININEQDTFKVEKTETPVEVNIPSEIEEPILS